MTKSLTAILPLTLLLSGCDFDEFAPAREREDFHYTHNLKSGGHLELEGFNGSIEITGWDKETAEIHGTKSAPTKELLDDIKIEIASTPDTLRIRAVRPVERRGNLGVKFILSVPKKVMLDRVASSNGSIRLQQVEGTAKLRTSNGAVRASDMKGDIDISTSNGAIELSAFTGGAVLKSTNGSIRAEGIRGYFEARTSNGGIDARIVEARERAIRAESTNGKIALEVESLKNADIIASTSNSSLTLRLPAAVAARVKASTSNASIASDFDVSTTGTLSKNRLEGNIGAGGPMLDLHSTNGAIRIQKL